MEWQPQNIDLKDEKDLTRPRGKEAKGRADLLTNTTPILDDLLSLRRVR